MVSEKDRVGFTERIVGVFILFLLVVIAVLICIRQGNYGLERFGTDPVAAGVIESVSAEGPDLTTYLPAGFAVSASQEEYLEDNLSDKINGKAPLYIEAGFRRLYYQGYSAEDDDEVWLGLYLFEMTSNEGAFSVFSTQRRSGSVEIEGFDEAFSYRTENGANFVKGNFYIEIIGSEVSKKIQEGFLDCVDKFDDQIDVEGTEVAGLDVIDRGDLEAGSIKLYIKSAFGFGELKNVYSAKYKVRQEKVTVFWSDCESQDKAKETAAKFVDFLVEDGAKDQGGIDGLGGGHILDYYGLTEVVITAGEFFGRGTRGGNQRSGSRGGYIYE